MRGSREVHRLFCCSCESQCAGHLLWTVDGLFVCHLLELEEGVLSGDIAAPLDVRDAVCAS